jgi:hypothetical protein
MERKGFRMSKKMAKPQQSRAENRDIRYQRRAREVGVIQALKEEGGFFRSGSDGLVKKETTR